MVDIGLVLRGLRKSAELTQQQVAERIGVTKSMISAYEISIRQPSYEVLLKLSDLYRVSTDFILGNHSSFNEYSLDGLTEEQVETVLKIIRELKKANGVL